MLSSLNNCELTVLARSFHVPYRTPDQIGLGLERMRLACYPRRIDKPKQAGVISQAAEKRSKRAAEDAGGVNGVLDEPGTAELGVGKPRMRTYLTTIILLCFSNVFMTFAWYGHLKNLSHRPWVVAALVSWGIALFEYLIQVPANRIGHQSMNVGQLKILQEVITLSIFIPFSVLYLREKPNLDYLWAGLCLLGAVFFLFKSKMFGA